MKSIIELKIGKPTKYSGRLKLDKFDPRSFDLTITKEMRTPECYKHSLQKVRREFEEITKKAYDLYYNVKIPSKI